MRTSKRISRGFPKLGVPFRGSNNKDYNILGSILGSPYFGKLPNGGSPALVGTPGFPGPFKTLDRAQVRGTAPADPQKVKWRLLRV